MKFLIKRRLNLDMVSYNVHKTFSVILLASLLVHIQITLFTIQRFNQCIEFKIFNMQCFCLDSSRSYNSSHVPYYVNHRLLFNYLRLLTSQATASLEIHQIRAHHPILQKRDIIFYSRIVFFHKLVCKYYL